MTDTAVQTGIGTGKQVAKAMSAKAVEDLAVIAADAKTAMTAAKEAFAAAEKEWFNVGHDDYTTADGRRLTTIRSTVRSIDGEIVKAGVGRGVWQRITQAVPDKV